ncbi:UDP-glucosyltransferase, putative [Ricinus communis]|uniref:Glycosyltransferase n=1 Tax=Ricinus communis TaxID=3988 RepID=B9R786_RICCO|nr:UDP-glucosyltransferase, putative [Ricinus communis]|eukprot:XP_002510179.1 scopoletin glucosyltransferase [Ricinus communis]
MVSGAEQIHVMFLPYLAPGHMMPMIDIARLFASNGIKVTIITTTKNAIRFKSSIDRDIQAGRNISLEILRFPSAEAGLPEGCENLASTPTPEMSIKLFHGIGLLEPEIKTIFLKHSPDCIVSDYLFPWTVDVAVELGIPRLAFSGSGFFNLCVANSIECNRPHDSITSETESFVVPGLPDLVNLTRSQLPDIVKSRTDFSDLFDTLKEAERKSFGVLMNSFYELEPAYADHFTKVIGIKAWHLGPVSLFADDKVARGDKTSVCEHTCLRWLDSKKPNSVIYVCFGSLTRFNKEQIVEIASALEDSSRSFIWVVGKVLKSYNDNEKDEDNQQEQWWLPEGYEERLKESGKGLVIKGWAPQVMILEHPAIGGFLTHCGWNSILEGLCAGVPMVTWPIFAEQFYNEKLVTQVVKFGVPVGNEIWKIWATQESPLMSRKNIENAVRRVVGDGGEAMEMRKRARRLAECAKKAVEEGGSSYNDLKSLIDDIRMYKHATTEKKI